MKTDSPYPTAQFKRGDLAEELYVLTRPEIRAAELLDKDTVFPTADGHVLGHPGNVAVTAYGGERYPIPSEVFFGTYEVIGQVGNHIVARRLVHTRRAWPVTSPDGEFEYADKRGVVTVARGGWLYQSEDDDFGVINPEVHSKGHFVVGKVSNVDRRDWPKWFATASTALLFLPPVLAFLALAAVAVKSIPCLRIYSHSLLGAETVLLILGVAFVVWMRTQVWGLKAAVRAGKTVAEEFQLAAELLGEKASSKFPQMTLWRAAQDHVKHANEHRTSLSNPQALSDLAARIGEVLDRLDIEHQRAHRLEKGAEFATGLVALAVVIMNVLLMTGHAHDLIELCAIWLPSIVGALHNYDAFARTQQRQAIRKEFIRQLRFGKDLLLSLISPQQEGSAALEERKVAAVRLLCKVVGNYCQEEVRFAISLDPRIPV